MAVDDSARNKTRNTAQKVKGQFKEAAGKVKDAFRGR